MLYAKFLTPRDPMMLNDRRDPQGNDQDVCELERRKREAVATSRALGFFLFWSLIALAALSLAVREFIGN
jgi:hypothetical protein